MSEIFLITSLVLAGLVFVVLEIFVIPGFGVGGVIGLGCLVASGVIAWSSFGAYAGMGVLFGAFVFAVFAVVLGMKSNLVKKRFILSDSQKRGSGMNAEELQELLQKEGVALTDLRPAGVATIDGKRVDVISDGEYIEAEEKIVVKSVDGPAVSVKKM